jgi:hypothetical protein
MVRSEFKIVAPDISLELFLSLYGQAFEEENVDFGYFRFWNLLKAMGVRYVPGRITVTDF